MNQVILEGNLGSDPVVRQTTSGVSVCNFRMATNERYTDKEGQKREATEWHRITVWGKLAEICGEHLSKGRSVLINGKLKTRSWEQDGSTRYSTEIEARDVKFLDRKKTSTETADPQPSAEAQAMLDDSDVPF